MTVKRIVANIHTMNITEAKHFYQDILRLNVLMDHGWITTYGSEQEMKVQISFASQGGSETPTPDLSIEVDDVDVVHKRMKDAGLILKMGLWMNLGESGGFT